MILDPGEAQLISRFLNDFKSYLGLQREHINGTFIFAVIAAIIYVKIGIRQNCKESAP